MAITEKTVAHIAHLARLELAPEAAAPYSKEMNHILEWVEQMQNIDTTGVVPMAHPLQLNQRLRSDTITEGDQHVRFQQIAPKVEAGLYLVPKVIE